MGSHGVRVAVILDRAAAGPYAHATVAALDHAAPALATAVEATVLASTDLAEFGEQGWSGVVVGPGSPYRDPEAVLGVVRTARERGLPLVGT